MSKSNSVNNNSRNSDNNLHITSALHHNLCVHVTESKCQQHQFGQFASRKCIYLHGAHLKNIQIIWGEIEAKVEAGRMTMMGMSMILVMV